MISDKPLISTQRIPWWLWLNVLSLDAPIIAMLWQEALTRCYHVKLIPGCQLALGLAVWLIYLVDRTLDTLAKIEIHRLSVRHAFYRRHRKLFAWLIIPVIAVLLVIVALTEIPSGMLWSGLILAYFVGLYLLNFAAKPHRAVYVLGSLFLSVIGLMALSILPVQQSHKLIYGGVLIALAMLTFFQKRTGDFQMVPKELLCGYLFAVGCSMGVSFYTRNYCAGPFSPETIMLGLLFALNCIGISCYERKTDACFDASTICQTWPGIVRVYPVLLLTLAVLSSWMIRLHVPHEMLHFAFAILLGTLLLATVHLFSKRLRPDLSHVLADAAVALPIIIVMVVQ